MTSDKLSRVLWRLRTIPRPTNFDLRRAIMHEIGRDDRTIKKVREQLIFLGMIVPDARAHIKLTNKEL